MGERAAARAFLGLGSNLGDRQGNLRTALAALGRGPRLELVRISKVYETEPVEVSGEQPYYLNCAAELTCGLTAFELLRYCQGVEMGLGREGKGEKAPRAVDVDVLVLGEEVVETEDLAVPHHGVLRAFNLKCLADLDPGLRVPGYGVVGELLDGANLVGVEETQGVEPC